MLVDVRPIGMTGAEAERVLAQVNVTVNKNLIPFDPAPQQQTSGMRLGTPAITTRGMGIAQMEELAEVIASALKSGEDEAALARLKARALDLCGVVPHPGGPPGGSRRQVGGRVLERRAGPCAPPPGRFRRLPSFRKRREGACPLPNCGRRSGCGRG